MTRNVETFDFSSGLLGEGRCRGQHVYPTESRRSAAMLPQTLCQSGAMDGPELSGRNSCEGSVVGGGGCRHNLQVG